MRLSGMTIVGAEAAVDDDMLSADEALSRLAAATTARHKVKTNFMVFPLEVKARIGGSRRTCAARLSVSLKLSATDSFGVRYVSRRRARLSSR